MNKRLEEFKNKMNGARVTVLGIGVSNRPLISYLVSCGAHVSACDKKTEQELGEIAETLQEMGVTLHLGEDYLRHIDGDIVFKTPGMRFDIPELEAARTRGAEVTSEMEVLFDLCPSQILAVTGSDGKTTTTTLIYEMLRKEGYHCYLGGNIGTPLLDQIDAMKPEDKVVLELSSFQLHTMRKSPSVAVVTNLAPNHLDKHKDMAEYVDAKKNIFRYQSAEDRLILNADNDLTRSFYGEAVGEAVLFGRKDSSAGIHIASGVIYYGEEAVLKVADIGIPGEHNVENFMAAIGAVWGLVSKETIQSVAKTFPGVAHRIEFVRELLGVRYYNDSIASSPSRTHAGLLSFNQKVILIAGGKDKKVPYDSLGYDIKDHVKVLIVMGDTAEVITDTTVNACGGEAVMPIYHADSMEDAVKHAKEVAKDGDIVILSPASTSFDRYDNFEERGNHFKKVVEELA